MVIGVLGDDGVGVMLVGVGEGVSVGVGVGLVDFICIVIVCCEILYWELINLIVIVSGLFGVFSGIWNVV